MTTLRITGKVWKSGKRLVIGVDSDYYPLLKKLRGKKLYIDLTPIIKTEKEDKPDDYRT